MALANKKINKETKQFVTITSLYNYTFTLQYLIKRNNIFFFYN